MGQCTGCSTSFPALSEGVYCSRCNKKSHTQSSEWSKIDNEPYCHGCGVIWPFLIGDYCAACKKDGFANGVPATRTLASSLSLAADAKERVASASRLHQKKPGTIAEPKEKLEHLRRANRATQLRINATLWYWPKAGKGAAQKVQMNSFCDVVKLSDKAEDALLKLLAQAQINYLVIPSTTKRPELSFERKNVNFSIAQGSETHTIENYYSDSDTVEDLFNTLKQFGLLSGKSEKDLKVVLRITAFETPDQLDEDIDEPVEDFSSKRRLKSSASASSVKRKRSESASGVPSSQARSVTPFKSAFRTLRSIDGPEVLEYEDFEFLRREYEVDVDGTTHLIKHDKPETITVVKGWQHFRDSGMSGVGGYISKGYSKYAFRGRFNGEDYALFQCNMFSAIDLSNEADLLKELKLLVLGEYFMEMFYQRTHHYNVDNLFPTMEWNVRGAFVGELTKPMKKKGEAAGLDANFFFTHFLAAPLLPIRAKGHKEVKFCGNTDVIAHSKGAGAVINAFIHATLVHSKGQILFSDIQGLIYPGSTFPRENVMLFDPQAHTIDASSGYWDQGRKQIRTFIAQHQCDFYCDILKLEPLKTLEDLQEDPESDKGSEKGTGEGEGSAAAGEGDDNDEDDEDAAIGAGTEDDQETSGSKADSEYVAEISGAKDDVQTMTYNLRRPVKMMRKGQKF